MFRLSCIILMVASSSLEGSIIKISNGYVNGTRGVTFNKNESYLAFRGIPYAKPPVGQLRFQVSQFPLIY